MSFNCEGCGETVADPYTKGWIHFDGHIAVAFGRQSKGAGGHGISNALNAEFYCCSLDCWITVFCEKLDWEYQKDRQHGT